MGGNGGAEKLRNCIKWTKHPKSKTYDDLKNQNEVLDHCEKKLKDYMELKRGSFPRFYFLSDDELIDILANSTDLKII
jgi:dynein heavy chain